LLFSIVQPRRRSVGSALRGSQSAVGRQHSVLPVLDAGLAELVEADHEIAPGVSFLQTNGHTPCHASVLIESDGKRAVITGDAMHHPVQMRYPDWQLTEFDSNGDHASRARRALLEQFVDTDTLFIGSHFASPTAGFVRRDGDGFRLVQ
jgi:glyoxylase-like metal-dependent hydrolase (beta-lactamase superfamily II)